MLEVYTNAYVDNGVKRYELNKERNIRATYKLYDNEKNTINYDFKVVVKSPVYTADASNVTTKDLSVKFGKVAYLPSAVAAKFALGFDKDKNINLFGALESIDYTNSVMKYSKEGYALDENGLPIEIDHQFLLLLGMDMADYVKVKPEDKFYLTRDNKVDQPTKVNDKTINLYGWSGMRSDYKTYGDFIDSVAPIAAWDVEPNYIYGKPDSLIKDVTFEFTDKQLAEKFVTTTDLSGSVIVAKPANQINTSDLVSGKVVLEVKATIVDAYNLKMSKTFKVTISK